ncbi:hypothetical protein [Halalkalibacter akibai]|uniref:Uncharacterized protein n=1 Tax=Halalkalibacter akibai (strain ATCC 43226 / DSM 21942 / CIP 109018 / JCM 9157 / 1139) TaxID=1236973 RepID=W4R0J0_HALA3|nr:hypothetical protein [Halalkalibacter akibai]GAE37074.1 hypothetical protein JCM9157_4318 [Halalkalibacter akibai JCM 9157]
MERTNEQLQEALLKVEEATHIYKQLLEKLQVKEENNIQNQSLKSLKVLVNAKQTILNPSITFEDIGENSVLEQEIPSGHMLTTFYKRSPYQPNVSYLTEPVCLRPWLAYRMLK